MKNEKNITIEDLRFHYQPLIWDSVDHITNLSDETVGYYAYKLQEVLIANNLYNVLYNMVLKSSYVLVPIPLQLIVSSMDNLEVLYTRSEMNTAQRALDEYEQNPVKKEEVIAARGESWCNDYFNKLKEGAKTPFVLNNYELRFMIWHKGCGHTVVLRNGYLLKCLNNAEIKSFDELKNYNAVVVYNSANVNPHICSFVRFELKNNNSEFLLHRDEVENLMSAPVKEVGLTDFWLRN